MDDALWWFLVLCVLGGFLTLMRIGGAAFLMVFYGG